MKFKINFKFWPWLALIFLAIFIRFYNNPNFLYFINDQGRDAIKLKSIVEGDLTLIGPTSGLPGFFLGPLWYYVGVPGYIISHGSPYGISLWYIFIASLSIPFFFLIIKKLFAKEKSLQILAFGLLAFLPSSINGSTFIWNPLLSLPLMAAAIFALLLSRSSRTWLFFAFLLLGFVLHSEFAYGIFILPILFVLIFWIRNRFSIIDYLVAGIAILTTLVPQILFELKNNFLMSKSLFEGITSGDSSSSLISIWLNRPQQLFVATSELFFGHSNATVVPMMAVGGIVIYGIYSAFKKKTYEWQIISLITIIPYVGYMFWRGNYGNFFSYYVTPHFIPLVLIFTFGLKELMKNASEEYSSITKNIMVILTTVIFTFSLINIYATIVKPDNNAGLKTINLANSKTLQYQIDDKNQLFLATDSAYTSSVITFTPNYLTAQYDFDMQWQAKLKNLPIPNTQIKEEDKFIYIIVEPDREIPEKRFAPWYKKVTQNRVLIRKEKVGILLLETWVDSKLALENKLPIYQESIREKMCW